MSRQGFGSGRNNWRGIVVLGLALQASAAWACHMPPPSVRVGIDAQIDAATDVAVAKVVDAIPQDGDRVEYHFEVQQRLAGYDRATFTLTGGPGGKDDQDTTFGNHTDPVFWRGGGGRVMNGADCAMHPGFIVGQSYLVFLGDRPTWRSYEKIDTADGVVNRGDQWLAYVRARLRGQSTASHPVPLAGAAGPADEPDYQRVGRFIYAFHRAGVARQALTGFEMHAAPPALAARARLLAATFDHILQVHAQVPDDEIAAALREAGDLGAALAAWRAAAAAQQAPQAFDDRGRR